MERYDIFVCYRGNSAQSCELGSRIYNKMSEMKNYNVFFAPECIDKGDNFKLIVPKVMKDVSIVLLLLDEGFFDNYHDEDDIVAFEITHALKNKNILFLPIFIRGFTFKDISLYDFFATEEIERIKHINGVEYNGIYNFSIEKDLVPIIDSLYDGGSLIKSLKKRNKERYYGASDAEEENFLDLQQNMLYNYDQEIFDRIMSDKKEINILDIGCNNGLQITRRFAADNRVNMIVGIDREESCITQAKENYPEFVFDVMDVENSDFRQNLKELCTKNAIDKFDLINVSMVVLHLERPAKFILTIREFLKDNGVLFIRDIDDGLNVAYPDESHIFERLTNICTYCDMLGFRRSGRQIYSYLKKADFLRVKLEKTGLDTSTMSIDEKEALFDIYFGYIPIALEKTIKRNPTLRARLDLKWVNDNLEFARESFLQGDFLFSLGYVIYTASIL